MQVVDASVVVKWVLPEAGRRESLALLDAYEAGGVDLISPPVLREEVASALARRCRRKEITAAQVRVAFQFLEERWPRLVQVSTQAALELALRHQFSLWDCLYLALAARYRCEFVTADRRLYRAAKPFFPLVNPLAQDSDS